MAPRTTASAKFESKPCSGSANPTIRARCNSSKKYSRSEALAQKIFELHARIRFGIAIFHDHGSLQRESPFCAGGMRYHARAWNHDRFFGNDQRFGFRGGVDR